MTPAQNENHPPYLGVCDPAPLARRNSETGHGPDRFQGLRLDPKRRLDPDFGSPLITEQDMRSLSAKGSAKSAASCGIDNISYGSYLELVINGVSHLSLAQEPKAWRKNPDRGHINF